MRVTGTAKSFKTRFANTASGFASGEGATVNQTVGTYATKDVGSSISVSEKRFFPVSFFSAILAPLVHS